MIVAGDREGRSSHPVGQGAENPDLRLFLQLCVLYPVCASALCSCTGRHLLCGNSMGHKRLWQGNRLEVVTEGTMKTR